ncbi:hypothetical protein Scep_000873 [Stephania cephalantha]|uniref:Uncharacterized protein n=1 Tax=Stephania cephalantha TaxID=152367 RepID=A0AAP0Q2U2_9MAGN
MQRVMHQHRVDMHGREFCRMRVHTLSNIKKNDLIIARGGTEGEASESSENSLGNEERDLIFWILY